MLAVQSVTPPPAMPTWDQLTLIPETVPARGNGSVGPGDAYEMERLFLLGRMVSAVSHELNSRLTSVIGYADLLRMHRQGANRDMLLDRLHVYTENLRAFVESISGFSTSRQSLPQTFSPNRLLRQLMDLGTCEAKAEGLTLELDIPEHLPDVAIKVAETRLALFMCLDALIRHGSKLKAGGKRVALRIDASPLGSEGFLTSFRMTFEDAACEGAPEAPESLEFEHGMRSLQRLGMECRWKQDANGSACMRVACHSAAPRMAET
ncbi:MAG: hypothetical protein AMXMBFR7_36100 [Planctomycetota bacterium]